VLYKCDANLLDHDEAAIVVLKGLFYLFRIDKKIVLLIRPRRISGANYLKKYINWYFLVLTGF
jgi:hypothetical protein